MEHSGFTSYGGVSRVSRPFPFSSTLAQLWLNFGAVLSNESTSVEKSAQKFSFGHGLYS